MAAYLSGVTRSPLTSFIITMEMTGSHQMLLALMAVSLLATLVSRYVSPVPLIMRWHKNSLRHKKPPQRRIRNHDRSQSKKAVKIHGFFALEQTPCITFACICCIVHRSPAYDRRFRTRCALRSHAVFFRFHHHGTLRHARNPHRRYGHGAFPR